MTIKLIYNYHPDTLEFISVGEADVSPLEPGVFLIPAHATEVPPKDAGVFEAVVFDPTISEWALVPDYRGAALFSTTTKLQIPQYEIKLRDTLESLNATFDAPTGPYYDFIDGKWVENVEAKKATIQKHLTGFIQEHLDLTAQAHGYDNIHSAALRAGFEGPFRAEGIAFAQWMDGCWLQAYSVLDEVKAALRPVPDKEELIALLPPFNNLT